MSIRTKIETSTEVTLATATASIAFPTASSDGVDISKSRDDLTTPPAGGWQVTGSGGHVDAAVFIESSAAQTFSGGLGIYGWRTSKSKWYLLGQLNNGTAIATLGSATGWAGVVQMVGIFDRLAIGPLTSAAVTTSTGTATITCAAIRQSED